MTNIHTLLVILPSKQLGWVNTFFQIILSVVDLLGTGTEKLMVGRMVEQRGGGNRM